ncbi:hypothetical protein GZ77_07485 [Endozoicomonas montiporae]|uniref:VWFA domain-containing protein n=2 Tax=Endozoicomonas montiporae TaxID=1027273 RepID=A0A081N728_9GAMM|nr:TadE/TadG family type IV pilus assembly protein [Endozoicomonas montiporae]AMO55934.1 tight adherence protein G [Endozoicomonas montiporae CL-33]KEQ14251.1 hypothetical protein GZ77_07485 [Endozoicomonas montiporae]
MKPIASKVRQRGVAVILFAIMLPVLMGMLVLGVEGARFLRVKADVGDAVEVASLALSARDELDAEKNRRLATTYIEALVPNAGISQVQVKRTDCEDNRNVCDPNQPDRFTEYEVSAVATFQSWFPGFSESGFGFDRSVRVSSKAVSRKYQGVGAVDVFLVADFSGSMNFDWDCSESCSQRPDDESNRINKLMAVVKDVAEELEKQSRIYDVENTIALIPFNLTTRDYDSSGTLCRVQQAIYSDSKTNVEKMFDEKECIKLAGSALENFKGDKANFHTIDSTNNADSLIKELKEMTANHGTASFEGIIRSAQLANQPYPKLVNPRRLIIVLSDGKDKGKLYWCTSYKKKSGKCKKWLSADVNTIHQELLEQDYCSVIRKKLNSLTVPNSKEPSETIQVQSKIAAIGFGAGYNIKGNANINQCAGIENVYMADNDDDIRRLILYLIAEEIGHLYDRGYNSNPS